MHILSHFQSLALTYKWHTFSFLLALICSEKGDTKPIARANQVRPCEPQAKKQQSATLPTSSKPVAVTAATTRHRDGAAATKKTTKTTGKAGSSTQAKANPRNTNNTSRGTGKLGKLGLKTVCLPTCLPAWKMCLCLCLKGRKTHYKVVDTCMHTRARSLTCV